MRVQLIHPKEFVIAALDVGSKTFVVYAAIREQKEMAMYPNRKTQIKAQSRTQNGVQVGRVIFDKACTEILAEYSDYSNFFSVENAAKLLEKTEINANTIKQEKSKQLFFGPIYSLSSIELEMLKTFIKTNLANGFICLFKSPAQAPILFNKKSNGSFRLCINYWGLNNITIKNQYLLFLIGKSLDRLG